MSLSIRATASRAAGVLLAAFVATTATSSVSEAATRLKISGQHATDHSATAMLNQIAEDLEAAEVGLSAKVFPANQLGDYTLVYEDIVRGNVDIAHLTVPSQLDPNLEANYFPFLVSNYDEMRKVYSPGSCFYGAYSKMQADLGVRLLGIVPEGFIGVGLTKPAENLFEVGADKNVLIRVPPIDTFNSGASAMGFRGTTIAYADLYPALQTGVADGWIGGTAALNYFGFRDIVKEFVPYRAYVEATAFVMSEKTWLDLTPEQQGTVADVFAKAAAESIERSEAEDAEYLAKLEEAGIKVHPFEGEVAQKFAQGVRDEAWPALEERFGSELINCMQSDLK
ncbi:TRAP transporter substrate-binding protein DctP (plasmid) [Leisingera sp. M527]|uniref:TRAP transporter substrate-binding protein DctP n=1 Tax=Leisingera sp. M527 TaxID=2867014 RepID=UPI0021A316FB|nr:TRAP transporter substrate-binding protein DctP [Leisingera sp. M527]UWQ35420.1 TRAP transporter substrate-binding protein DctP [Leisingera sp. M527]